MKIFIDTANLDEIIKANAWGIIDGVTTNPTLIAKESAHSSDIIDQILGIIDGPVCVEVLGTTIAKMVEEAQDLSNRSSKIVIKIPITPEGLKAVKVLSELNIKTNVTLVFSVNQALFAAKAGATYVSSFVGRLDDIGQEGMIVIRDLVDIYSKYHFPTQIIVASIRHPNHVIQAAKAGADIATVPFNVLKAMFIHPLTDIGLDQFLSDGKKINQ
jgi:transaldolase